MFSRGVHFCVDPVRLATRFVLTEKVLKPSQWPSQEGRIIDAPKAYGARVN